jgi:hypothetical protein
MYGNPKRVEQCVKRFDFEMALITKLRDLEGTMKSA